MRQAILSAALLAFGLGLQGCKAKPPCGLERAVLSKAKHSIFVGNKSERNPVAFSPKSAAEGKEAFSHYCIACHGLDGQNTGVPFADRMFPPVPSLAAPDIQSYTDGQLKWLIDNGIGPSGMPSSKGILSDDEQWAIVIYLRHLPPAGSLGEPAMYGN